MRVVTGKAVRLGDIHVTMFGLQFIRCMTEPAEFRDLFNYQFIIIAAVRVMAGGTISDNRLM
jgi:hypothetical protein